MLGAAPPTAFGVSGVLGSALCLAFWALLSLWIWSKG